MKKIIINFILTVLLSGNVTYATETVPIGTEDINIEVDAKKTPNSITFKFIDEIPIRSKNTGKLEVETKFITDFGLNSNISKNKITRQISLIEKTLNGRLVNKWRPLYPEKIRNFLSNKRKEILNKKLKTDLENYYIAILEKDIEPEVIIKILNSHSIIEIAYLSPIPENAESEDDLMLFPSPTPNFMELQRYLKKAPQGIDAIHSWTHSGGQGENVTIIDIEAGWNVTHEDLGQPLISKGDMLGENHGTAVLGEMVALENPIGMTGISHKASYGIISAFHAPIYSVATAVVDATMQLDTGDVILIEQHAPDLNVFNNSNDGIPCQENCRQHKFLPMEFFQAEFDAIRIATVLGRVVVEAAGNGSQNLDHKNFNNKFDYRTRDSGAIIVGAGTASTPHKPLVWSNYGTRVNLQGWGEGVHTLGYGDLKSNKFIKPNNKNRWYTDDFSGTSSAAPMVAGAVANLQGIQKAHSRNVLTAIELRELLVKTGTPQESGHHIGPLPNLKKAISHLSDLGVSCTSKATFSSECDGHACENEYKLREKLICPYSWDVFKFFCRTELVNEATGKYICNHSSPTFSNQVEPSPVTKEECLIACRELLDGCMESVSVRGGSRSRDCAKLKRGCDAAC